MKNIKATILVLFCLGIATTVSLAKEGPKKERPAKTEVNDNTLINLRIDCRPSSREEDLKINNVQSRLQVGGDIWWDRDGGRYIVPKVATGSGDEEVSSIFAGGIWLGGLDPGGNLKLAISEYGQGGFDYYPGPLNDNTGLTEQALCQQWDRFFKVAGDDVRKAIRDYDNAIANDTEFSIDSVEKNVRVWPGQGNENFEDEYGFRLPDTNAGLGAFWDENGDNVYSPELGDFPIIDIRGCEPTTRKEARELLPDEMIFWIYNDAGNTHDNSNGAAIRMEIQVQSFAYATNDEVNDMTFYRYKLINRASEDIRETYFAMWVDPDLGCFTDDYSGCDVERSLAYTYNSDEIDGTTGEECDQGTPSYGSKVPIVGTDYFRGPTAPKVICEDNDSECELHVITVADSYNTFVYKIGDSIWIRDPNLSLGEDSNFGLNLGMSSCIIYFNPAVGGPPAGTPDPQTPEQYYNYLQAIWPGGEPLTVNGFGLNAGSTDVTKYSFPAPPNMPGGWSMAEEGLPSLDTRTVQASGPFLLKPGAVNELIVGAVWVPDVRHPRPDLAKLTTADDIAQNLFDSCFDIIDGPDAPTVCTVELDQEIILVLNNDLLESNNAREAYSEIDLAGPSNISEEEKSYKFEGYKVFQLVANNVSPQELDDVEKARIVAQVDIANGVSELYNWEASSNPVGTTDFIYTPELKVAGSDEGIQNTFRITTDQFSSGGSNALVNHKKYYYMAVAYAYNNYRTFNPDPADTTLSQQKPYLEGRGNVRTYTATPRPIVYKDLNAEYGDGVKVTRISGVGIGGNAIDMEDDMYDKILTDGFDGRIDYKEGAGPLTIKVYNPLEVKNAKFQLAIEGDHSTNNCAFDEGAEWVLTNIETGDVIRSDKGIDQINEQLIVDYGISVEVNQSNLVGTNLDPNNGAVSSTVEYASTDVIPWYRGLSDGLQDEEGLENIGAFIAGSLFNFIKNEDNVSDPSAFNADPTRQFNSLGDGSWVPFPLTTGAIGQNGQFPQFITPAWLSNTNNQGTARVNGNMLRNINNVDIILTSDKSKWSRCVVVETGNTFYREEGDMLTIKTGNVSLDKSAMPGSDAADDIYAERRIEEDIIKINEDASKSDEEKAEEIAELRKEIRPETGMSYFPGYAVDVETGKRLNMFFGENSTFNEEYAAEFGGGDSDTYAIGDDMLYNPNDQMFSANISTFEGLQGTQDVRDIFSGGQHFIYVTRQEYDGCDLIRNRYNEAAPFFSQRSMYLAVTWCSMSMCQSGQSVLSYADNVIPSEVKFKLRVERPYNIETFYNYANPNAGCLPADLDEDGNPKNPVYEFEILGKEAADLTADENESALDNIRAVPNPYYAYSAYETSGLDQKIKITNVPDRAVVTIFSLDGKFITQFDRAESTSQRSGANPGVNFSQTSPEIEWDLKNSAGIPIASGVYLIHISAPDLGLEKTIKWFGVSRKFDAKGLN